MSLKLYVERIGKPRYYPALLIQFASRCFRRCRRDRPSCPGGCYWPGFCAARPARAYRPPSRIKPVSVSILLDRPPGLYMTLLIPRVLRNIFHRVDYGLKKSSRLTSQSSYPTLFLYSLVKDLFVRIRSSR